MTTVSSNRLALYAVLLATTLSFSCSESKKGVVVTSDSTATAFADTIPPTAGRDNSAIPMDVNALLDAKQLSNMTLWTRFDVQKYLLGNGFKFLETDREIIYLFTREFGFPSQIEDYASFISEKEGHFKRVKHTLTDFYRYTDEQFNDVRNYQGDPLSYPDPFHAEDAEIASTWTSIVFECDNETFINELISQIENKGCKFSRNVLKDLHDENMQKIDPNFKRDPKISNMCVCSVEGEKFYNGRTIYQEISVKNERPVYSLIFQ